MVTSIEEGCDLIQRRVMTATEARLRVSGVDESLIEMVADQISQMRCVIENQSKIIEYLSTRVLNYPMCKECKHLIKPRCMCGPNR